MRNWIGQDLNGDEVIGFNTSNFQTITSDTVGVGLKKDTEGNIYIVDSSGNNPIGLSDAYGGYTSMSIRIHITIILILLKLKR